jgi:hypothetical protein
LFAACASLLIADAVCGSHVVDVVGVAAEGYGVDVVNGAAHWVW